MTEPEAQPILEPHELIPNSVLKPPSASQLAVKRGGKYVDPDSGEPVAFEVPPPPDTMGRDWSKSELRSMRRGNYPSWPHVAPEVAAAAERQVLEDSKAEGIRIAAEYQRTWTRLLREPSANVDSGGVAHFLLIEKGSEVCGGCREDWPCGAARRGTRNDVHLQAEDGSVRPVGLEDYAGLAGVDAERLDARLRKENPGGYEQSQR